MIIYRTGQPFGPLRGPEGAPPGSLAAGITSGFHDLDHFAALVFAAMGAGAVCPDLLMAVRAFGQLRHEQRIVRAPVRGPPLRMTALRIWHSFSLVSQNSFGFARRGSELMLRAELRPQRPQAVPAFVRRFGPALAHAHIAILPANRTDPFARLAANQAHRQRQ